MGIRMIAIAGAAFLLLCCIAIIGGGEVATAQAPRGGCVVAVSTTPHAPSPPTAVAQQTGATLTADQMAAARTVVGVGKALAIAERGIAIALGVAMQESTLNPNALNGRSVGLFQQQGQLYASVNRTDPADASRAFYDQLLARVPQYTDPAAGSFAEIAQTVQQSGAGADKYARWEGWATALAHELITGTPAQSGTTTCTSGGGLGKVPITVHGLTIDAPPESGVSGSWTFPNAAALKAATAALSYLGTPYAWGGGDLNGPTYGQHDGGFADAHGDYLKIGFDCSGLTEYAYGQASVFIGRDSASQRAIGGPVYPWSHAVPGDLVFWGGPAISQIHHVALYLGIIGTTPYMVEAPQSGEVVTVSPVRVSSPDFRNEVVRPSEHLGGGGR